MRSLDETKASLKGCMMKLVFPRLENCRMCMFFKTEHCDGERHARALAHIERLEAEVDKQPTVDAVEVVRCKDCKHRGMEGACPKCFEVYVDDDWYDWYTFDNAKDEGFCDRGERRDENAAD
jgi:hypothetical protein